LVNIFVNVTTNISKLNKKKRKKSDDEVYDGN
jgi:hypothetical protein